MSIGELAQRTGTTTETLRSCEQAEVQHLRQRASCLDPGEGRQGGVCHVIATP